MTAVILAGGKSRRMKADKAGLDIGGRALLEHVLTQLEPYFDEILISVTPGQALPQPGRARVLSGSRAFPQASGSAGRIRVVDDETPGLGPIGGLLATLKIASNEACAVVACDIPEIDISLLRSLARAAATVDVAVPVGPSGLHEPLFAVYRRSILPAIRSLLGRGERSLLPLYQACRTAVVRFEDPDRIRNLNTRREYADYLGSRRQGQADLTGAKRRGVPRRARRVRPG
jgi:molybdopterin-guanine dinucleotide biosynthesis protein A